MSDKKDSDALHVLMKDALQEQFDRGVQVGSAAMAKLVLDKINNRSRSIPQRITDVQNVCRIPIKNITDGIKKEKESETKK